MKADIMEAMECLHSWLKSGIVVDLKQSTQGILTMDLRHGVGEEDIADIVDSP